MCVLYNRTSLWSPISPEFFTLHVYISVRKAQANDYFYHLMRGFKSGPKSAFTPLFFQPQHHFVLMRMHMHDTNQILCKFLHPNRAAM